MCLFCFQPLSVNREPKEYTHSFKQNPPQCLTLLATELLHLSGWQLSCFDHRPLKRSCWRRRCYSFSAQHVPDGPVKPASQGILFSLLAGPEDSKVFWSVGQSERLTFSLIFEYSMDCHEIFCDTQSNIFVFRVIPTRHIQIWLADCLEIEKLSASWFPEGEPFPLWMLHTPGHQQDILEQNVRYCSPAALSKHQMREYILEKLCFSNYIYFPHQNRNYLTFCGYVQSLVACSYG